MGRKLKRLTRFAPWISRAVLAGAALIFSVIGLRNITDPVHNSAKIGIRLGSALASTTTRVESGALPLGLAIFAPICLLSSRWLFAGVGLVSIVITTAIVVRVFGSVADGPAPESTRLFIPEALMLALSVTAITLEVQRRRIVATRELAADPKLVGSISE
ncbi:MAG TPA: hypothetical protein VG327_20640 [Mycobacterium sp.]|nr:hypothetical protein [Mycobacterium sp.]